MQQEDGHGGGGQDAVQAGQLLHHTSRAAGLVQHSHSQHSTCNSQSGKAVTTVYNIMHSIHLTNGLGRRAGYSRSIWMFHSKHIKQDMRNCRRFPLNCTGYAFYMLYHHMPSLQSRQTLNTAAPHCHSSLAVLHSYWRHSTVLVG